MSLSQGRSYLAIPGPSVMPDRVLSAMHRAAPNIYEGELHRVTASLMPDLRTLAGTRAHVAMYITNGHGSWEAAVSNVFSPGDRALVLSTGRFALGWAKSARARGVETEILDFGNRATIDIARLAEALQADKAHAIKAVAMVQTDTSTSVRNDVQAVRAALDAEGHPALLLVDCICSMGCDRFEMDAWGVDVVVSASQKGLMTPPGLGFVWFSDKAAEAQKSAACVTDYWDWAPRAAPEEYWQYWCGTAPTHHVYGLRAALDMILEEGLSHVWDRHATLARAYWAAFEAWGAEGPVELNIADPALRSHAVTAVRIGSPHGTALRDWVRENCGVTLGIGLGMAPMGDPAWHGFFRVGHMGHLNAHMVLGTIGAIEAGLTALKLPHGKGGLDAAAAVISGA
ncbi:pyridoxal-phosphate-dependent aminotransferase family protein [Frigidibacter sp. ROC022]|uniref:pyridoxal-phosphate-dependent aminotransferase family protein n=1 Tax=Frigidibacter sp. ROC022 TaxID=2971796 RepID=UPI00215AD9F0|nr:aminotransferase class V-fold PLP-dependent enzyme [Frigidibacter sp. ROC022]MCR8722960.1 aminotransferase class V-fold PLP-dependent enzyme [Frigidibacter sp. ROC022]